LSVVSYGTRFQESDTGVTEKVIADRLGDRQRFFELFARVAEWVPVTTTIRQCRDPKDDKFLKLAVDGYAHWIITGDKDLRALQAHHIDASSRRRTRRT
jgi:putative PIN family toxin of toxin-antitoxin system